MPEYTPTEASNTRNLKRLFNLRSLMIAGEFFAIMAANQALDLGLPLAPLMTILGLLTLANIWTWLQVRRASPITDRQFLYQLCIDVFAIAGLLYFTGGATNPFAWLFLIPVIIAATVLSAQATWLLAGLSILFYSLLMHYYIPLASDTHLQHGESFSQHVFGMWFGFVMSAALVSWFVVGMARTLRERDRLLSQVREQALRDEKLVALGTLAAGAAHELGTPLSTMAVVVHELERNKVPDTLQRKIQILKDQIDRCKAALNTISASAGELRPEGGGPLPVNRFIDQLVLRWQQQRSGIELSVKLTPSVTDACVINEQTLVQALINLLNNAADASIEDLALEARWDSKNLFLDILDRGPGIKPRITGLVDKPKTSDKEFGLGLGLFLAHATIQRLGGDLSLTDRNGGGTQCHIRIPLTQIP